jgi:hypothetical protein
MTQIKIKTLEGVLDESAVANLSMQYHSCVGTEEWNELVTPGSEFPCQNLKQSSFQ